MDDFERRQVLQSIHERLCLMKHGHEPMSDTERRLVEIVGTLVELQLLNEARQFTA